MNDRLIYRARIADDLRNENDLRVMANEHGALRIFLTGIARALAYAGINEILLPASVAEGGGTNAAIAAKVRAALSPRYRIAYEWIEPEREPRFMVQWENAARAEFYSLEDIVSANAEGDPDLCEWARGAEVGDSHITGGGAAPAVTTWRVV